MILCENCRDTGVDDAGGGDMPCECPAGDRAVFNVAGRGQVSGATLKKEWENLRKSPLPDYLK